MKVFNAIKYLLLVFFLAQSIEAGTSISDAEKMAVLNHLFPIGLQCMKNYPLSLSELKTFKNNMMPEGDNPKCFAACMYKKAGIMDEMGMLSPATTRKNAEQVFKNNNQALNNVDAIMQHCSTVNQEPTKDGEKGCDRAKLAFNCLMQNAPKYGFDFNV